MTEGTSQGLFVVVAIVIFGIFIGLTYTLFGSEGLSNDLEGIFTKSTEQALNALDSNRINPNLLENKGYTDKNQWLDRVEKMDGKDVYVFNNTANMVQLTGRYELVVGQEYTFSFKAKSKAPTEIQSVFITKGNDNLLPNQKVSTEWEIYSVTFTAKNNTSDYFPQAGPNYTFIHMYPKDLQNSEFYITDWKLETGNKATRYVTYAE